MCEIRQSDNFNLAYEINSIKKKYKKIIVTIKVETLLLDYLIVFGKWK